MNIMTIPSQELDLWLCFYVKLQLPPPNESSSADDHHWLAGTGSLLDRIYKKSYSFSHYQKRYLVLAMAASSASYCLALLSFIFFFSSGVLVCTEARRSSLCSQVSKELFDKIFLHKDDNACPAKDFYTYDSFLHASEFFPKFGNTGSSATRKREVAAFLAQISHETTGGWATAPDGPYAWGLCFKEEVSPQSNYCDSTNKEWPCYPGKSYKGRGPIQLSW